MPAANVGSAATGARLVTGNVLKFAPRNRRPVIEIGPPEEVSAKVPVKSDGNVSLENNCVRYSEIW